LALAVIAAAGCGDSGDGLDRQAIWGTVTLDGKPLESGQIQFQPPPNTAQPVPASGTISAGKYSIPRAEGPVPGTYQVAIFSGPGEAVAEETPGKAPAARKEAIPTKYNAETKLKAEVKPGGDNAFNYDLTSEPAGSPGSSPPPSRGRPGRG
jgi:hypothetical protein